MSPALRMLRFVTLSGVWALAACASIAGFDPDGVPAAQSSSGASSADASVAAVGKLVVSPTELTIPETHCSGDAPTASIQLRNDSDRAIDWDVSLPTDSVFVFEDGSRNAKGQVSANANANVTFRVDIKRPGTFSGDVLVTTTEGVVQIKASTVVKGAELTVSPSILDFGQVRQKTDVPPQNVTFTNGGNEAITILGFEGLSSEFTLPGEPLTIEAGASMPVPVTFVKGEEGPALSAELTPQTATKTCGELPKMLLKGTRVSRDVILSTLTAAFGDVDCSSAPGATRKVVISNYSPDNVPMSVTLAADSWFTAEPSGNFTMAKARGGGQPETRDITIAMKPIGAVIGPRNEDIIITTEVEGQSTPSTLKASLKSVGGFLVITPTNLDVGSGYRSFRVTNKGNKYINVRHASSNPAFKVDSNFGLDPDGTWFGTTSRDPRVTLSTSVVGPHEATISTTRGDSSWPWPSSGRLCNDPGLVQVTGFKPPPPPP